MRWTTSAQLHLYNENYITVKLYFEDDVKIGRLFILLREDTLIFNLWKAKMENIIIRNEADVQLFALFINIISKMLTVTDFKNT